MAAIRKFEDILAWQKARELTRRIYDVTNNGKFSRDFGLRDQIRRASVSVMSNIAEGFGRESQKEFIRFLRIALSSCHEVQSELYVAKDTNYLDKKTFSELYELTNETSCLIGGLIRYLKERKC